MSKLEELADALKCATAVLVELRERRDRAYDLAADLDKRASAALDAQRAAERALLAEASKP